MPRFRNSEPADLPIVLEMMKDFYVFEHLPYDRSRNERLLTELLSDDRLGRLLLIENDGRIVGYAVLGFGFSVEFGGRDALLDEFYILPEHRSHGIGAATLEHIASICRELDISSIHLEADDFNDRAYGLYRRLGFEPHSRRLMTRRL